MPRLDASNVLLTNDGLIRVDELYRGCKALGLIHGRSALVEIADVVDAGIAEGVHIYSVAGDATIGSDCRLATLGGLAVAETLTRRRRDGPIGRMTDDLPRVEILTGHDLPSVLGDRLIERVAGDAYLRLLQAATLPATHGNVIRIGGHPKAHVAAAFGDEFTERLARFVGQAEWDWLRLSGGASASSDLPVSQAHALALASLVWKTTPTAGSYSLPIEFDYIRRLTTELRRSFGKPGRCVWQPLYSPATTVLDTNAFPSQLVDIDCVIPTDACRLITVTLQNPDALLCAGGLLLAA